MVRCLVWLRLSRARKIMAFFKRMEKDIRVSYLLTRIVKLITVELYFTHTAACVFYYLATTLPPAREAGTWLGSLTLGDARYINFREIDLLTRYVTSLYFAIVTMATVGTTMLCSALVAVGVLAWEGFSAGDGAAPLGPSRVGEAGSPSGDGACNAWRTRGRAGRFGPGPFGWSGRGR